MCLMAHGSDSWVSPSHLIAVLEKSHAQVPPLCVQALGNKAANRAEQATTLSSDGDVALSKPKTENPAGPHRPDAGALTPLPTGAPVAAYSKTLDYKSCQTIMCLTKEMARHLLPSVPASVTATGAHSLAV